MELLCLAVLFVLSGYVSWAVCEALRRAAMLGGEENGEEVDYMKKIARRRKKRR